MGKGTIISSIGKGEYALVVDIDRGRVDDKKTDIDNKINNIDDVIEQGGQTASELNELNTLKNNLTQITGRCFRFGTYFP